MSTTTTPPQRPNTNNPDVWRTYWKALDQLWRTEPEIDSNRQNYLRECLAIVPNPYQGKYPFKEVALSRADVEWLLATCGKEKKPVDLQASLLREVNLSGLPLEEAWLHEAHLEGALLSEAHLDRAHLREARLEGADLSRAHLDRADLIEAHLDRAYLIEAHLDRAHLSGAHLEGAYLRGARLEGAYLGRAHLEGADLREAHLEGTVLRAAHLEGADLMVAYLEGADLMVAYLEGADLRGAHLDRSHLRAAHLERADLSGTFFTGATDLSGIVLGNQQVGFASLAGVRWGEVDLSVVDWTQVTILGDEQQARQQKWDELGATRLDSYRTAVRANRQLAVALRDQGLNEEADRFAYRAQILQRVVWRLQRRYLKYVGSWLLWLLAGHGYRSMRSLLWYLAIIIVFALAYSTFGHLSLWPPDAFVYSLTSFHGRGFFPGLEGKHSLHDPLIMLAAFEAVVGLFIEISFIATFTQRFFGK